MLHTPCRTRDGISAQVPDWSREAKVGAWDPPRSLLAAIRSYQRSRNPVVRWLAVQRHRFWSIVTGAEIPIMTQIGGGLQIPHPNGIVIHPCATIGPNCLIMQHVTIGMNGKQEFPRIGGHVDICTGSSVLGGITIGDHAVIGAHALVMKDVPAGAVMLAPLAEMRGN